MIEQILAALGISLLIQAVFFAGAATFKTDKVTDLSYGLTFVLIALWLLGRSEVTGVPQVVLATMVVAWGARLAGYLFYRILRMGRDARFDGVRERFWPFLTFWLGQGLAVWVIMLPVTAWFREGREWNPAMTAGLAIWAAGLTLETVADAQKFAAKTRPGGESRWVETGLWAYARHPNYFGEMLCWWGVFLFVAPDLGAWSAVGVLGPACLTYLLLKVTGIPTLQQSAARKWGADPEYHAYVRRTRLLIPLP